MNENPKSLHEINSEAIEILCKELGIANTVRFINQYHTGLGNYTQDRKDLFKDLSLGEIISQIRKKDLPEKDN